MKITSKNYTQPLFGDLKSPNSKGNNGYGYDEHDQYIKQDNTQLDDEQYIKQDNTQSDDEQYIKQDNTQSDDEQYIKQDTQSDDEQYIKQDDIQSDDIQHFDIPVNNYREILEKSRICIVGAEYNDEIKALARTWFMDYKGEVFYDDGEEMTDDHKRDMTALYFDNTNKNKTQAFIDEVKKQFPSANAFVTNILDESDIVNLDFEGLDNNNELQE